VPNVTGLWPVLSGGLGMLVPCGCWLEVGGICGCCLLCSSCEPASHRHAHIPRSGALMGFVSSVLFVGAVPVARVVLLFLLFLL